VMKSWCIQSCEGSGCVCKPDYYRCPYTHTCIPKDQCPGVKHPATTPAPPPSQSCGPNQVHKASNECFNKCNTKICPDYVVQGCFCRDGYCEQNGVCVPKSKCNSPPPTSSPSSSTCGPNEEHKSFSSCFESCNSTVCPLYLEDGCFCKSGYCREKEGGPCVLDLCNPGNSPATTPSQPMCGRNEEYKASSSCFEECDSKVCPDYVVKGCYCKTGYCRKNGQCVLVNGEGQCGRKEHLTVSNRCLESCDGSPANCSAVNPNDPPACYCKPGLCRQNGKCVRRTGPPPPTKFPSNCPNYPRPPPTCTTKQPIYIPYDPKEGLPVVVLYPKENPPCPFCVNPPDGTED
jgi:hypothetical protein